MELHEPFRVNDPPDPKEDSPEESLVGSSIPGSHFFIEKFLRHGNHSDVYLVSDRAYYFFMVHLCEARTYVVDGIPPKLRQHRLRNIKRLAKRSIFETKWEGLVIVVYRTNEEINKVSESSNATESSSPDGKLDVAEIGLSERTTDHLNTMISDIAEISRGPQEVTDILADKKLDVVKRNSKAQRKTDHQRETSRLRQFEKRKSTRLKERQLKAGENRGVIFSTGAEAATTVQGASDEADLMFVLLHLAYDDKTGMLRPQLPAELKTVLENTPASRSALERYLQRNDFKFQDDNEMEEFMKIKQREGIMLGLQQKELPALLQKRHDEFEQVLREQFKLPRNTMEWRQMQLGPVARARQRLKLIQHVEKILPRAIEDSNESYRNLRRKLLLVREEKARMEKFQALNADQEKVRRKVAVLGKYAEAVVPGSALYAQLMIQFKDAEKELELSHWRFQLESYYLTDSQNKYRDLLETLGDTIRTSIRP